MSIADLLTDGVKAVAKGVPDALSGLLGTSPPGKPPYMLGRQLLPEYTCFITCSDIGLNFKAPLPPDFDWSIEAHYDTPMRDFVDDGIAQAGLLGAGVKAASRASGISFVTQALTAKFWSGSATGAISLPLVLQAETDEVEDVIRPLLQLMSLSLPRLSTGKRGGLLEAPGPSFDLAKVYNGFQEAVSSSIVSVAGVTSSLGSVGSLVSGVSNAISSPGAAWDSLKNGVSKGAEALDSIARSGVKNQISLRIGNYISLDSVVITNVQHKHILQPVGRSYGKSSGNMQRVELNVTFEPFMDLTQQDLPSIFRDPRVTEIATQMIERSRKFNPASDGFVTDPYAGY